MSIDEALERIGPVNVAYVTSFREIVADESVGQDVTDDMNGKTYGYRRGNLEDLARRLTRDDRFSRLFNLGLILHDDDTEQLRETVGQHGHPWPTGLRVPRQSDGRVVDDHTLDEITRRIPSQPWKDLRPVPDETEQAFRDRKATAKAAYERELLHELHEHEIDLVVSDSYATIFGPTMLAAYEGRMLNIHPAITDEESPHRLPGITPTRDAYTRARFGYVIRDDKNAVDTPEGEPTEVRYEGEVRDAVAVQPSTTTGVTVHVITEDVDEGPVVQDRSYDLMEQLPIDGRDELTPEAIREQNYSIKRELLPDALKTYVARPDIQHLITATRDRQYETPMAGVG